MRMWWLLTGVTVLAGGTAAVGVFRGRSASFELLEATVESRPLTMSIETSGTVEPLSTVDVGCEVTGKIIEMAVDHDQPVRKGQVLCKIDPELAQAENNQSKADFTKAQIAVSDAKIARDEQVANLPTLTKQALGQKKQAEASLVESEYNWKRTDELRQKENASEAEWTIAKSRWLSAQGALVRAEGAYEQAANNERLLVERANQAVAQAEAALKLAQARLDFTSTRVERCTIRSPIDGIVLRRYFDVGNTVTAAFQTPIIFLLSPSLQRMRVNAKVSESDISHIEVGQKAGFTIEAKQPTHFQGVILHKRNQPDVIQNVVTYTVNFEVDNPQGILIPGLSVNVVIECVAKGIVPLISNAALRFKPPLAADLRQEMFALVKWPDRPVSDAHGQPAGYCSRATVWRFDEKKRSWSMVPLWVGITDNAETEVLAGAKPGERFVKKFIDKSEGGFSLKEAIRLARPDQRTL